MKNLAKLTTNPIINAWWNSVKDVSGKEGGWKNITLKTDEIKEVYEEKHGKILGECACCKQTAHDRFGMKFNVPKGYTSELPIKNRKLIFCGYDCMVAVGISTSIQHLVTKMEVK
tara:strand:- start:308 stop:652 length:345 start_codon:yes stop_codon:yes gene_type:complete